MDKFLRGEQKKMLGIVLLRWINTQANTMDSQVEISKYCHKRIKEAAIRINA